jgi:pimeloyl-ACP methyl ester carboxylesterase
MFATAADGARLWFDTAGAGPAVLLLHGLADDHGLWRYVAPRLARSFRVISADVRGHGASEPGRLDWDMGTLVDDVLRIADASGAERFAVVGLSMGGGIAQGVALSAADRVWLLGLVSTSSAFSEATRRRFIERASLAERDGMSAVVDDTVPRWFTPRFMAVHREVVEATRATVRRNERRSFAHASRVNARRDWTARLGEIHCGVVVIAGEDDPADVPGNVATFRAGLSDLEVHVLRDASHLIPVEHPLRCAAILRGALRRAAPK